MCCYKVAVFKGVSWRLGGSTKSVHKWISFFYKAKAPETGWKAWGFHPGSMREGRVLFGLLIRTALGGWNAVQIAPFTSRIIGEGVEIRRRKAVCLAMRQVSQMGEVTVFVAVKSWHLFTALLACLLARDCPVINHALIVILCFCWFLFVFVTGLSTVC